MLTRVESILFTYCWYKQSCTFQWWWVFFCFRFSHAIGQSLYVISCCISVYINPERYERDVLLRVQTTKKKKEWVSLDYIKWYHSSIEKYPWFVLLSFFRACINLEIEVDEKMMHNKTMCYHSRTRYTCSIFQHTSQLMVKSLLFTRKVYLHHYRSCINLRRSSRSGDLIEFHLLIFLSFYSSLIIFENLRNQLVYH
jgi:hypothetical protein